MEGRALFQSLSGNPADTLIFRAPARLNLFGEHIDYVSYLATSSLAIGSHEYCMTMYAAPNDIRKVRGWSENEEFPSFEFSLPDLEQELDRVGQVSWEEFLTLRRDEPPHWKLYVMGAAAFFRYAYPAIEASGFDFLVSSGIPPQGGSSSSSALVVLAGAALRAFSGSESNLEALALESSRAEWFVGTRGGALDHSTICLARKARAVHLTYKDNSHRLVDLPGEGYKWVSFFTQAADKGREILLEYNERAAVSRILIPGLLEKTAGTIEAAVDQLPAEIRISEMAVAYPELVQSLQAGFPALYRKRADLKMKIRDRARHHLGELARVGEAVRILESKMPEGEKMKALGGLLDETHESLRDLYGVSIGPVEDLRSILCQTSGVLGSRIIGGGFGGNILALVETGEIDKVVSAVTSGFYEKSGRDARREGAIRISTPGDGLRQLVV